LVKDRKKAVWAPASKAVIGQLQRRLGALVLEKKQVPLTDEEALPALVKVSEVASYGEGVMMSYLITHRQVS
jgi:hypothetical protein